MRFREPLLGGSTAMPGASLQRACRLLVAVCALHLGVTLVYYLAGRDLSRLPQLVGVSTTLQSGSNANTAAATRGQPSGELRTKGVRPPPPLGTFSEPRRGGSNASLGPSSSLTSVPVAPTSALLLPACPEESPLLGKDWSRCGSQDWGSPAFPRRGPPNVPLCSGPRDSQAPLFQFRVLNGKASSGLAGAEKVGGGPLGGWDRGRGSLCPQSGEGQAGASLLWSQRTSGSVAICVCLRA